MKLIIPDDVYQKVIYWVKKADFEVSGFGKVVHDPQTDTLTVVDAYLLKQEGGSAHTDIDPASLGKLMFDSKDDEGHLGWWWHSHVKMSAFWSGQDRQTIETIGRQGWCIATVFNHSEENLSAFCGKYQDPLGVERVQFIDKVETEVIRYLGADAVTLYEAEFAQNVTEKKFFGGALSHRGSLSAEKEATWKESQARPETYGDGTEIGKGSQRDLIGRGPSWRDPLFPTNWDVYHQQEAAILGLTPEELNEIYLGDDMDKLNWVEASLDRYYNMKRELNYE